jgi:hypothetical protein
VLDYGYACQQLAYLPSGQLPHTAAGREQREKAATATYGSTEQQPLNTHAIFENELAQLLFVPYGRKLSTL